MAASQFHYEGKLSAAVQRFKYAQKSSLAAPLGSLLSNHSLIEENFDAILPVPLHISRLRKRGFNQSQLLAEKLGEKTSCKVDPYILKRIKPTLAQVGMEKKERMLNVKDAFQLRKGAHIEGRNILLVDDVYTTGATVRECSKTLKQGGAKKVAVVTLARVVC